MHLTHTNIHVTPRRHSLFSLNYVFLLKSYFWTSFLILFPTSPLVTSADNSFPCQCSSRRFRGDDLFVLDAFFLPKMCQQRPDFLKPAYTHSRGICLCLQLYKNKIIKQRVSFAHLKARNRWKRTFFSPCASLMRAQQTVGTWPTPPSHPAVSSPWSLCT